MNLRDILHSLLTTISMGKCLQLGTDIVIWLQLKPATVENMTHL